MMRRNRDRERTVIGGWRSGVGPRAGLFVAAIAAIAAPVQAQNDPLPADTLESDTLPVMPHPAIVVRALRAPVVAEALPFAVAARDVPYGVRTSALSLEGQLQTIPGLQVQNRHTDALGDRIVVRGFGARAQFGVRGVQVLVDGIPATMPDGQSTLNHLDLSLLDRVEILRGPAAAAYGNAAGGVLLLNTLPPPTSPFRQDVEVTGGADGLFRLRSTTGGGSGERGWMISLSRETIDGFRPHSGAEQLHVTGRGELPVAGGRMRLVAHGVSYDAENPGSLTLEQYSTDPHQAQAYNVGQGTGEEGRHGQLGLTWERPVEAGLVEATVYALGRSLENPIPPTIIDLDRTAGGARLLLRSDAASSSGASWAVGVDAAVQADDRLNFENIEGARGDLTLDQTERVLNTAVHGQALIPLLDRLGLFLAGRYDRVSFSADDQLITVGNPDDSGDRTMDAFSPTAGLRLDVTPDLSVFGNVSTAFETPTTTELVNRPDGSGGFNQVLEPQRTLSYELGARAVLGRALRLEGSVYHARVRDALVPFEVSAMPGRQYFRNAAAAVHQGVELLAELRTTWLDVVTSYSLTDAEFSDYSTPDRSYDGLAVPGVRPWTFGAQVVGHLPWGLDLELDYRTTDEMAVDDANESWAPGHHLVDLRAGLDGLEVVGLDAEPYLGVTNLLDERYVASVVPNAFGGRFFEPGPGRGFYLGVRARFEVEGR